jgi:hypothetical protein
MCFSRRLRRFPGLQKHKNSAGDGQQALVVCGKEEKKQLSHGDLHAELYRTASHSCHHIDWMN